MGDPLRQIRHICVEAIRRCELAERQAGQLVDSAGRQRQAALTDARGNHTQARQQADAILKDARGIVQQADAVLAELGLTPGPSTSFSPPSGASLDELARLLQNQRGQAREALTRLKATAEALKAERRKWWKVW